jgi:hypothetical protein
VRLREVVTDVRSRDVVGRVVRSCIVVEPDSHGAETQTSPVASRRASSRDGRSGRACIEHTC